MFGEIISRDKRGESILTLPDDYTVVDLETTGLSAVYDEIIEVAGLKVRGGCVTDKFQQLVKPHEPISDFISSLTGITNEMVLNAPDLSAVIGRFIDWVGDDVVLGHNVTFDVNFIYDASMTYLNKPFYNDFLNTVRIARRLVKDVSNYRLSTLCEYYDIRVDGAHRALCDCLMTNQLFTKMKSGILEAGLSDSILTTHCRKHDRFNRADARLFTSEVPPEEQDCLHPLYGKVICFTGTLERFPRAEAMQLVANIGGINANGVTQKTDYLVLGSNDYNPLVKGGKSGKQRKAEAYQLKGSGISIMDEHTFYDLVLNGD